MRKIVDVEGVGDVLFERSSRAKYINISVRNSGNVRVAVPGRVSFKKALKFFHSKSDWVNKHLEKIERIEKPPHLAKVDRKHAREILIPRLKYLAEKHGFEYNKVALRNQKTRWGSCSSINNINLNINLVSLPQDLMDYVILHELTHTKIKNHSKDFWKHLGKHIPNPKQQNKKLRNYAIHLG
ncbi:MAG: M48 family metallopeptidase [Planctomycetes bacterium]|nr:M48 family metallopeptidase [Planctomycetota bacterium]